MKNKWDERYNQKEFIYGTEPNEFLKDNFHKIPKGKILFLAEGEGRNAVFLAKHKGYNVTAMDSSSVGMKKAQQLAEKEGVKIETIVADLNNFDLGEEQWDGIVSIFCHLPPDLRKNVHRKIVKGLKHNGVYLAEAYNPDQLEYKTGGPPVKELLVSLNNIKSEFNGLNFIHAEEKIRAVHEGKLHFGTGAVVQLIAVKP